MIHRGGRRGDQPVSLTLRALRLCGEYGFGSPKMRAAL